MTRKFYRLPIIWSICLCSLLPALASDYSAAGIKDSAAFDRFYNQLRYDVIKDDRVAVSKLFHYPMNINTPNGAFQKALHIDSADMLVKQYEHIFPQALVLILKKTPASSLGANWQGVTMADGCLWFSVNKEQQFTILAINVPSGKSLSYANQKNIPEFIFSTWQINKVISVGGHAKQNAHLNQVAIGKQFTLLQNRIVCDHRLGWLGLRCENPTYQMKTGKKRIKKDTLLYEKGDLGFYGIPGKNPPLHIAALCNNKVMFVMEVTADNRLANYYDGWFFFADKK